MKMPEKSIVIWNSMITAYGMHGHADKTLEMFMEMEKRGMMPNDVTFTCIFRACSHGAMEASC